jgi:hypothetical protein
LTVPSCTRGFDLVARLTRKSAVSPSHLPLEFLSWADTPIRLTASHGPAQSHMPDNHYSSATRKGHLVLSSGRSKRRQRLTIRIVDLCLLKPSMDVLRQCSLPNTDLRIVTYLIIPLLPKDSSIYDFASQMPLSHFASSAQPHSAREHRQESPLE